MTRLLTIVFACSFHTRILIMPSVADWGWNGKSTDAIFMNPDAPAIEGKSAIQEWITRGFSEVDPQVTVSPVEIVVDHDLAFNRTHVTGFQVDLETGDTVFVDWKEIATLRRQPDGSWLVSRVIGNSNVPMN